MGLQPLLIANTAELSLFFCFVLGSEMIMKAWLRDCHRRTPRYQYYDTGRDGARVVH